MGEVLDGVNCKEKLVCTAGRGMVDVVARSQQPRYRNRVQACIVDSTIYVVGTYS
jgi:hypothetical protein